MEPVWSRVAKDSQIANLCRLSCLFKSNRDTLYERTCAAIVKHVLPVWEQQTSSSKLPFKKIAIPGDGRCGWAAIRASFDLDAFCAVPRTSYMQIYIYILLFSKQYKYVHIAPSHISNCFCFLLGWWHSNTE